MREWELQERREEMARTEVGHTRIHPVLARCLVFFFIMAILCVPLVQHLAEFSDYRAGKRPSPWPQAYEVFPLLPTAMKEAGDAGADAFSRVFAVNRRLLKAMKEYEDALDDRSVIGKGIRPRIQHLLTRLGAGNEKAYCGLRPWLFYRPGVDYLSGPPFLDPAQLRKRSAEVGEWADPVEPDPRPAIVQLKRQLAQRGITLIIVPTPIKAMIHPEKMSGRYAGRTTELQNPSYANFKEAMEREGVLVFDPAPALMRAKAEGGKGAYLAADTHWRPEAMEGAVKELKAFIEARVSLPLLSPSRYRIEPVDVAQLGDLAGMLDLPREQELFPREKVAVKRVLTAAGEPWQPGPTADVLVLGDSFSNMYSLGAMGWGEGGGFVEQLSYALQRPLDRIARNDNGSYATREILAGELARGKDRLEGKRLVIYQFAIRELAVGNWKTIDLKTGSAPQKRYLPLAPGESRIVSGVVEAVSLVPRPATVPYKDHVMTLLLIDLKEKGRPLAEAQAMVYMRSMTDNVWTEAARYRPGDPVVLRLSSWADAAMQYEGINRSELDDSALQLVEPCWGEPARP
jgi:alginate O-acetyltransferase complex protein AlgJ